MLDLQRMKEKLINNNLLGSWCEEFSYFYDSRELRLENAGYLIDASPETRIKSITPSGLEFDFNHEKPLGLAYKTYIKSGEELIKLSHSMVVVTDIQNIKAVPFKEYKPKASGSLINPMVEVNKAECRGINFAINTVSTSVSSKEQNTYTDYTYNLEFTVAVNQECFIYIIQTPDVNPPTILVCKERIGEFDLNDINRYVFKGNVEDGIYNSYFHPHEYNIQKNTNYSNLVFGSPDGKLNKIKFAENIKYVDETLGEYTTNDGIKATNTDGDINVYLEDYKIGSYIHSQIDVDFDDLELSKYKIDKDIFNDMHKVEMELSLDEIKNLYPDLNYILPEIPVDKTAKRIQHITTGDNNIVMRFEDYSGDDCLNLVVRVPEENTVEMLYMVNGNEKVYYSIYRKGRRLDIFTTVDENNEHVYYSATTNRAINYSRDIGLISYKENFWVNVDKANIVVNSNLPIIGEEFTGYNIFGVPKKF